MVAMLPSKDGLLKVNRSSIHLTVYLYERAILYRLLHNIVFNWLNETNMYIYTPRFATMKKPWHTFRLIKGIDIKSLLNYGSIAHTSQL